MALAQTDPRCRFRWVYCQVDYLCGCQPGRIRHALAELPDSLDETYERTLQDINKENAELAHRLFQCVAVASRPLRVEELAEFLAFDFNARPIPKFREDWRPDDPIEAVVSTCSLLLSVVNIDESTVIQFSHFSVKEFLTSSRFSKKCDSTSRRYHVSAIPAHTLVTQACLGILLHLDENVAGDHQEKFPLSGYAAEHWFEHARLEGVSENAVQGMKQLFDSKKPHLAVWLSIHDPILTYKQTERPLPSKGTALHYAAFCGLHNIVKFLAMQRPRDVRSQGFSNKSTPLHLASRKGFVQVARALVEHGARVSAENKEGWTPLHLTSAGGHVEVTQFLVERGARVSAKKKDGQTPLHLALINGHLDLARFFVEHGANVSVKDNDGRTPLHWAVERGHVDLAELLIEHGADVSVKDNDGQDPLRCVVDGGHVDLARLLCEHGADVSVRSVQGWTLLHRAMRHGHLGVAQILVKHGADVSAKDNDGRSSLRWVVERGQLDRARFLIEHGADVSTKDNGGRTPLHWAKEYRQMDLAQIIIEHGADVSAKDTDGSTPLRWAMEHGGVDLVRIIIEHGADVSALDNDGLTPVHWASISRRQAPVPP